MRAMVVYESMFGNTERIARAVAEGLSRYADVQVVEVGDAPPQGSDVDLLVVGGPTHAFSMSRPSTRTDAQTRFDGRVVSRGIGIREWLDCLPVPEETWAAAFDTKVPKARRLPGAARAADRVLRRRGYGLVVAPPETFYVADVAGPLLERELERALRWGQHLADKVQGATAVAPRAASRPTTPSPTGTRTTVGRRGRPGWPTSAR